jgi:nucleoside-diphosphate-sugar epimerase
MIRKGRFLLPAQGQGLFSPVYIDDLVAGIVLAAGLDAGKGQIYTISGSAAVSCEEFFSHHSRILGSDQPPRKVSTGFAILLAEITRRLVQLFGGQTELGRGTIDMLSRTHGYSIDKARRQLGYEPTIELEEGMARTEAWVRQENLL